MKRAIGWAGVVALVLGIGIVSTPYHGSAADAVGAGVALSESDFKKLVTDATGNAKKGLDEKGKAGATKARGAAVMLAGYGQYGDGGAPEPLRATLCETAIKLADAIKAGKTDDAKKLADSIADLKPDAKAKLPTVSVMKTAKGTNGELMRQFSPTKIGGLGIEDRLKKLTAMKKLPEAVLNEDFVTEIELIATIAALLRDNPPAKNGKLFTDFAEKTRDFAARTVESAKKKDGVTAASNLYQLTISCNKCHDRFRE